MEREIKFRGKRILEPIKIERYAPDGLVYGDFIDCSDEAYIAPKDISGEFYVNGSYRFRANDIEARVMMAQVDPNSVSQFTGLTDKNGAEIYEGDRVRFNGQVGRVVFEQGAFGIGFDEPVDWDDTWGLPVCYNEHFISFWEIWNLDEEVEVVEG